jgi:hypothetical protein
MPEVHRPGCWHAGGPSATLYPGQRTIAGNAYADNGDARGGKGRGRVPTSAKIHNFLALDFLSARGDKTLLWNFSTF